MKSIRYAASIRGKKTTLLYSKLSTSNDRKDQMGRLIGLDHFRDGFVSLFDLDV